MDLSPTIRAGIAIMVVGGAASFLCLVFAERLDPQMPELWALGVFMAGFTVAMVGICWDMIRRH